MGAMNLDTAQGLGGMLKEGVTLAEGVDEAVLRNIAATQQLAAIVRSSMGPKGMKKLVINHLGKTLVSSDCATIVKELEVVHPAAQMISMAAEAQHAEVGDGTNFVVSFAGELLKLADELLRTGLHTSEIVAGFEAAYAKCKEIVPELVARKVSSVRDVDELAEIVEPVLGAKQEGAETELAKLVAKASVSVMPPATPTADNPNFKVDQVRVAKIKGGDVAMSTCVKGMVLLRDTETSVKSVENAKIAVFNCGIEMAQTETKGTVLIRTADELMNYNKTEERALETIVKDVASAGCKVVVANGSISEMASHFLEKYELMTLRTPSKFETRRVCGATGASGLVRLGAPTPEELGSASKAYVKELGGRAVTVFEQDDTVSSKISTVVVRASTSSLLDDLERAVDDGVNTVRALARDPRLVYGAGAFELELSKRLHDFGAASLGLEQYAIKKFAQAFDVIPRALAENAGLDATVVLADLKAKHDAGDNAAGVDLRDVDDKRDAPEMPAVYDAFYVKESAIRLAVDAALTVLRVDQIIMSKPAGGPKPPKQGPPDAWSYHMTFDRPQLRVLLPKTPASAVRRKMQQRPWWFGVFLTSLVVAERARRAHRTPGFNSAVIPNATKACVEQYAANLSNILGDPALSEVVLFRVLRSLASSAEKAPSSKPAIIGIGPGSSGTRSLFVALAFLDVPGLHFKKTYDNCSFGRFGAATPTVDAFVKSKFKFWADTPVPTQWTQLLFRLPNAKFVLTSLYDASAWRRKRLTFRGGYCKTPKPDCQVPLALDIPGRSYPVAQASEVQVIALLDAYRAFARCAIPESRLLLISFPPPRLTNLWADLLGFLGKTDDRGLRDSPFPHWGDASCLWGDAPCSRGLACGPS
ncbi:hypothetical protein CTAYLR_002243 [Chrysophaeum taylorii]|uniref:CCT-theta n=1 Tax=Chrysophaeum taylorii TaxID=2483200 RepID=A0AAD7UN28_9STRA|nr:hypothetical protein CTAYLR_002243 [Chrysophaeum taylorii]